MEEPTPALLSYCCRTLLRAMCPAVFFIIMVLSLFSKRCVSLWTSQQDCRSDKTLNTENQKALYERNPILNSEWKVIKLKPDRIEPLMNDRG